MANAKRVDTDRPDGALSVLLAHILATKSLTAVVTDADMIVPDNWRAREADSAFTHQRGGHQEAGRTIVLHSICVAPKVQRLGLGKMIARDYLQRMAAAGTADHATLVSQDVG